MAPSHFEVLEDAIITVAQLKKSQNLKILDLGAGAAAYWTSVSTAVAPISVELFLLDATRPIALPEVSGGSARHIQGLIPEELSQLDSSEFDLVLAFDLIEHLTKENGYKLLYEVERLSRGAAMIFGPTGYVWQPPSENNPHNAHVSAWWPSELKPFGYVTRRGHLGLRWRTDVYGVTKPFGIGRIGAVFNLVVDGLVNRFPALAFAFSAVKFQPMMPPIKQSGVTLGTD